MLSYHTTTSIWLHLEEYHNRGLKSEQSRKIIEAIQDPFSAALNLSCTPMRINNNLIVRTGAQSPYDVQVVVERIRRELDFYMLTENIGKQK